jgi:TatD DNase family protein
MYLQHIAEELARDRGVSYAQVEADTTATARAFFHLPEVAVGEYARAS